MYQEILYKNNTILGYRLVDKKGKMPDIKSADLKAQIKSGNIQVVNLKLSKDGRVWCVHD